MKLVAFIFILYISRCTAGPLWEPVGTNSRTVIRIYGVVKNYIEGQLYAYNLLESYEKVSKGPRTVSYSICPNFDSLWLG